MRKRFRVAEIPPTSSSSGLQARRAFCLVARQRRRMNPARRGSFLHAGADPYLVARVYGDRVVLDCRRPVRPGWVPGRSVWEGPALELLRSLLPRIPARTEFADCPFVGGAVGYFGYEFGSQLDEIELHGNDDLGLPDCAFLFVDRVVALDRVSGNGVVFGLGFGRTRAEAVAAGGGPNPGRRGLGRSARRDVPEPRFAGRAASRNGGGLAAQGSAGGF